MKYLAACILAIAPACADGDVEIRMCNLTGDDIVDVNYHGSQIPAVVNGAFTAYERVRIAFSNVDVRFSIGSDDFVHTPIDYVGESPLEPGRWTHEIRVNDATHAVTITLVAD